MNKYVTTTMRYFLLLIFFCLSTVQGQVSKNYKNTSLQQVLDELAQSYDLIFSFSDDTVKNKVISLVIQNTPLDEVLVTLGKLTNLTFKKISDRQVIVSIPSTKVEVCGYLYDQITNAPLSYASVLVESDQTGTIANDDGFFQLGIVEENSFITIRFVGYHDKKVSGSFFKNSDCPRIPLLLSTTSLDEVLITEYITTGIDKNIDGSIGISNKELGILPGQTEADVLQSIQLIPGINSLDESAAGIEIRGGSPDQNLILWDQIKMYNTGHFFGMISAFNPNVIKSAKVFKGGADPKYGDRVSGIIDISSDKEVPKTFEGGVGVNGTHADAFLKIPVTNTTGFVVSARRSYTDYIETPTFNALSEKVFQNTKIVETANQVNTIPIDEEEEDEEEEEELLERITNNNFFFYDLSAKLIIDVSETDKILASGIYTRNDLVFEISDEEDLITDELNVQNKGVSFSWEGTKLKHLTHSIKGYYSKFDSDYLFTEKQETVIEEQSVRKNVVKDRGLDLELAYTLDSKNVVQMGYQFSNNEVFYAVTRESEFETTINESNKVDNNVNTLYANYKFLPVNKGFVNLGARVSHYSVVDKFFIEPRANVEYPLTRQLRIKATGEQRYQPISQLIEFEDTQLRLENKIWLHSDDEVPVLKSTQFSGGFLFSERGWNFEIDTYYKNITGLTSLTNGFNTTEDELSTGKSSIFGVDILLKKKFKNFRSWMGYTFNDIDYTFTEIQETSFSGNNDIRHNFRISNTYENEHWEFSLGWLWRSGAPFTDADLVDDTIEFGATNAKRLPAYHRLDVSAIYRFKINQKGNWRGQLGASILNIYNRQVPLSIGYRLDDTATGEIQLDRLQQESLGIMPNMVFRLYF
ncbi:carboxypeptidase-like regulatory domain-containing protein [Aquimarina sp. 2201CG1-2-11]|uniref:carboxypeptidase-like regulatory domain-containing protein n=1 Tax=Aquimarina discodermiae TaxID=3231043 RepID=UPI0034630D76